MEPVSPETVSALLARVSEATRSFEERVGLHCPEGCGACCLAPTVEATVLEMLPMALELYRRGEAEACLALAQAAPGPTPCVVYRPDPDDPRRGRCGLYAVRPTLCRLFGFAAVRSKSGEPDLAACRVHKEVVPEDVARARAAIATGEPVPIFSDIAMELAAIDPALGLRRLPINEALAEALSRLLLRASFGGL